MTTIQSLPAIDVLSGGDQFPVVGGSGRTQQIAASDMATYFNQVITGASISINASTSVITLTLGNGQVITGSVT